MPTDSVPVIHLRATSNRKAHLQSLYAMQLNRNGAPTTINHLYCCRVCTNLSAGIIVIGSCSARGLRVRRTRAYISGWLTDWLAWCPVRTEHIWRARCTPIKWAFATMEAVSAFVWLGLCYAVLEGNVQHANHTTNMYIHILIQV